MENQLTPYVKLGELVKQFEAKYSWLPQPTKFTQISEVKDCEAELQKLKESFKTIQQTRTSITSSFDKLKKRLMEPEQIVKENIATVESDLIAIKKLIQAEEEKIRAANVTKAQIIAENQKEVDKWISDCNVIFDKAVEFWKANPTKFTMAEYLQKVTARFASVPFSHPENPHADLELYRPDPKEMADALAVALKENATDTVEKLQQETNIKAVFEQVKQVSAEVKIADTKELKYLHEIPAPAEYSQVEDILNEYIRLSEEANKHIRVTSWENLKIGQIMKALAKCADEGIGINLETIKIEKL